MKKATVQRHAGSNNRLASPIHRNDETVFQLRHGKISLYPFGRKELYSDEYLKWMNDPEITKTIGRFDYLMPVSRRKLVEYFKHLDPVNTIFLAIYRANKAAKTKTDKGEFIGTIKIYDIDILARKASIGILIGEKREWGKGYAQQAIGIVSQYIFDVLGLRKITAGYVSSNIGMERAFLKSGFIKEAVFKEHLFYAGELVDHVFVSKFRS